MRPDNTSGTPSGMRIAGDGPWQAARLESIGFTPPDWLAYGGVPITIIFTLYFSPLVILLLGNALERFDPQLEDSARSLGAGYATVVRTILVPLMRPAILSAATLILAKVLGEFGVTYILGLPTDFNVLATSLYRNISTRDSGAAAWGRVEELSPWRIVRPGGAGVGLGLARAR